eukprot:43353-Hanusia_phi.AAC.1
MEENGGLTSPVPPAGAGPRRPGGSYGIGARPGESLSQQAGRAHRAGRVCPRCCRTRTCRCAAPLIQVDNKDSRESRDPG